MSGRRRRGGHPPREFTGRDFGRLHVLGPAERPANSTRPGLWWLCECRCPARTVAPVYGDALVSGNTRSCGCVRREMAATLHLRRKPRVRRGPREPAGLS